MVLFPTLVLALVAGVEREGGERKKKEAGYYRLLTKALVKQKQSFTAIVACVGPENIR